jgi:F0F1-type ATP synthase assembly protein I
MNLSLIKKHKGTIIGILAGAILGWVYYYFVGCDSGRCAISSNPYVSVPYGALMGYFMSTFFKK